MRLLSQALAQKLIYFAEDRLTFDAADAKIIAEQRDFLIKRSDSLVVFLFTTLTVIAVAVFGDTSGLKVFGIELSDVEFFVFILFMVGNAAYVIHCGLFLKLFCLEGVLFYIITHPKFNSSRTLCGLLYVYHGNFLRYVRMTRVLSNAPVFTRVVFLFASFYSRYAFIFIYAVYYFFILFYFLEGIYRSYEPRHQFYFYALIIASIFSTFLSFAIFLPTRIGASKGRSSVFSKKETRQARLAECAENPISEDPPEEK